MLISDRYFIRDIVRPLAHDLWIDNHGDTSPIYDWVVDGIDILEEADTLRDAFELVTRPLLAAIHLLYDRQRPGRLSHCNDVELTAVLERLLSYAVSGLNKTLLSKSMKSLGFTADIGAGMPQIAYNIPALPCPAEDNVEESLRMSYRFFPMSLTDPTDPLLSAVASIRYHAGPEVSQIYAEFVKILNQIYKGATRHAEGFLLTFIYEQTEICLRQFATELRKAIVEKQTQVLAKLTISMDLDEESLSHLQQDAMFRNRRRQEALQIWAVQEYPFSLTALENLLSVFGKRGRSGTDEMPSKGHTGFTTFIALNYGDCTVLSYMLRDEGSGG